MIEVTDTMTVPTLPIVVEGLRACGVDEVHARILDMLNLMAIGMYPQYFVETHATNLASSWAQWATCVTQYVAQHT